MMTLVTGVPGSGKSAYSLSLMLTLLGQKRPLFVHGVTNLTIPHRLVKCDSPACMVCPDLPPDISRRLRSANDWHTWAPKGAVLWWDEVQHIHRPRSSGSKVPPDVMAYETHRHRGLDFFMVTQNPGLIDMNVRKLVGRHVHLVKSWKGRTMFEWPECSDSLANKTDAIKSGYTLPKHVFPLYQSSQLHTKPITKIPVQVYILAGLLLLLGLIFTRFYFRFFSTPDPAPVAAVAAPVSSSGANLQTPPPDPVLSRFDYTPKKTYVPESAPAYHDLAKPVTFPQLAGCVVDRRRPDDCRCYTQQGTRYDVSNDMCQAHVKYGRFNPYKVTGSSSAGAIPTPAPDSPPSSSLVAASR